MSEKVLGFYEDSVEYIKGKPIWRNAFMVYENDTVPVRLASESVDLKWLEKWCKEEIRISKHDKHKTDYNNGMIDILTDLLKAVRLQAEKEAKKNE